MSQELSLQNAQLPSHVTGGAAQAAGMVTSESVPRISLKDASFRLKKDGNEINVGLAKPIQVVILGIDPPEPKHTAKLWYAEAWNADSAEAPDCSSSDGIRPDSSIADPQCQTCAQCPKNAWGSGTDAEGNPSKGKACSDRKNLLVVLGGKHIDGDVFRLSIPPTSLKALSTYGRELVRYNVNMHAIVTKISVDEDNSKAMVFSYDGFLDESQAGRTIARAASPELQEMTHQALPAHEAAPALEQKPAEVEEDLDLGGLGGDAPSQAGEVEGGSEEGPELDAAGEPWDAALHSSTKSKVQAGTWKKKVQRGQKATAPAKQETENPAPAGSAEPAEESMDDLLDTWGANV